MVKIDIANDLRLTNLPRDLQSVIEKRLTITNPDYEKKIRMGFYAHKTPKKIELFEINGETLVLPYGLKTSVLDTLTKKGIKYQVNVEHADKPIKIAYKDNISLYDYQKEAVDKMLSVDNGILVSPCGSGKTRMGIDLIGKIGQKALWLTHTTDLLNQSKKSFQAFYSNKVGTITGGKVNIQDITFATVQTMAKLDLNRYKDEWGLIIVDECHRATGGATKVKMFYKVITSLNAKYKYGLTATIENKENSIESTPFHILGDKIHEIQESDIKRVNADIKPVILPTPVSTSYLKPDYTIDYAKLTDYIVENEHRNRIIFDEMLKYKNNYNIILSTRLKHLDIFKEMFDSLGIECRLLTGKEKAHERTQALKDFEEGKYHFILSNYQLAKEGLDLPIADTLHLVFPIKDKTALIQSKGRVERLYPNKTKAQVIDYVDIQIGYLARIYKQRRNIFNV